MKYTDAVFAAILLAAGGCFAWAGDGSSAAASEGPKYATADRTIYYEFRERVAIDVYVYPKTRLQGEKFPPDEMDIWGDATVRDCSDHEFRCLLFDGIAIAVPRKGLSPSAAYTVAGNRLKVAKCIRGTDAVCQVALVSVECQLDPYMGPDGACVTDASKSPKGVRTDVLYFIYNEDYGVTAFGFGVPAGSPDDMMEKASEFHLLGDVGLLKT
jgi:hypothetical protein